MFLILLSYILSAVSRQDHSGTYKAFAMRMSRRSQYCYVFDLYLKRIRRLGQLEIYGCYKRDLLLRFFFKYQ